MTHSPRVALATLLGVLFLTFLDTTIVSVVLGDIVADVGAGVISLQWVVNAYALVFACLMLAGGTLGDRFGRRRVMIVGLVIFAAGSLWCAVSPSVTWIVAGRAVMGLGAAACEPGTLSVLRQVFPDPRSRARALGGWAAVSGLALALGPVIGGVLVDVGGWRSVFWLNVAGAVVLLVAVLVTVPESREHRAGRFDAGGTILVAAGLGCVIVAAISGEYRGFGALPVVVLFVVGGVLLAAFVALETRVRDPLVNLVYVRRPVVASALFAAFAVYFGVFAIFFFTALYLDIAQGYSGARLALIFTPMAVAIVVGSIVTGRWVARVGSRWPTVLGCALSAAGMLLARGELGGSLSFALLSAALALAGLGFGVTVVPLTSAVLGNVPARDSGMAASATNTARQLGAVTGVAALGAVVNHYLVGAIDRLDPTLVRFAGGEQAARRIIETGGDLGGVDISAAIRSTPQLRPFVEGFVDGLQWALLVAAALTVLAGLVAAAVRTPPSPVES